MEVDELLMQKLAKEWAKLKLRKLVEQEVERDK